MKVINEKDYLYVETKDGYHIFESNPEKKDFDKEILYVMRARYITSKGKSKFYDYVK
jgi:hypothetical protein